MERQLEIGDDVLIRIDPGLDTRDFGSGWRTGHVTNIGIDVLESEMMVELNDGGPPIYRSHISHVKWINPRIVARHE